jgi:alpha-D-xyloside xylohydrolase
VADDVRDVIQLRMRLLPYLYTAFANYNRHGTPPMRAMILEQGTSDAPAAVTTAKLDDVTNPYAESVSMEQDDQFMFGPSILVAPYYGKLTLKRTVKLPKGNWYDFYTGKLVGNGTTIEVDTPQRTPLFVKEGAVIPMLTKSVSNSRDAMGHALEVRHYGNQPGSFELYEDDGKTFDYEKADFTLRRLDFKGENGRETVTKAGKALFGPVEKWVQMTR